MNGTINKYNQEVQSLISEEIAKNGITLELIEINEFCLKIYDLWIHSTVGGSVNSLNKQVALSHNSSAKNGITLEPIEINEDCTC